TEPRNCAPPCAESCAAKRGNNVLPQNEAPLLTVALTKVPRILDMSRAHLARLRAAGRFGPAVLRAGRKLLVRREELERWVAAGMPPANEWAAMQASEGRRLKAV